MDDDSEGLPELTREDVGAFVQVLSAMVMMGATRMEIHAERWPLIFRGLILHRAFDLEQVEYIDGIEDMAHAVMHVQLTTKRGKINCLLMQRRTREVETQEQRALIDMQGPAYDRPEGPEEKLWLPH